MVDSPYDDNGYPKPNIKGTTDNEDPLMAMKKKYKKDYSEKVKVSTLKEK
jgi:hypothetical protein